MKLYRNKSIHFNLFFQNAVSDSGYSSKRKPGIPVGKENALPHKKARKSLVSAWSTISGPGVTEEPFFSETPVSTTSIKWLNPCKYDEWI